MDWPGKYGSRDTFGIADIFDGYQASKLLDANAGKLGKIMRLGYGNLRRNTRRPMPCWNMLQIAHEYRDGPHANTTRTAGWVKAAAELLGIK